MAKNKISWNVGDIVKDPYGRRDEFCRKRRFRIAKKALEGCWILKIN